MHQQAKVHHSKSRCWRCTHPFRTTAGPKTGRVHGAHPPMRAAAKGNQPLQAPQHSLASKAWLNAPAMPSHTGDYQGKMQHASVLSTHPEKKTPRFRPQAQLSSKINTHAASDGTLATLWCAPCIAQTAPRTVQCIDPETHRQAQSRTQSFRHSKGPAWVWKACLGVEGATECRTAPVKHSNQRRQCPEQAICPYL